MPTIIELVDYIIMLRNEIGQSKQIIETLKAQLVKNNKSEDSKKVP